MLQCIASIIVQKENVFTPSINPPVKRTFKYANLIAILPQIKKYLSMIHLE